MSVRILVGDAQERLSEMPDETIHCCVTSPPYYGLRDYGVGGQIGLEPTPELYVGKLVEVFREVRRVLRSDGTLWLNLGDSYNAAGRQGHGTRVGAKQGTNRASAAGSDQCRSNAPDLKPKDMIGIPWMVAFALRADGWWLRREVIWFKPNGMPDSTEDRPGPAHESVFMLSKDSRYFYDYKKVRLPAMPDSIARVERKGRELLGLDQASEARAPIMSGGGYAPPGQPPHAWARSFDKQRGHSRRHAGFNDRWDRMSRAEQRENGANLRDVWCIAPAQFPGAHFAVMPEALAALCIAASCPEGGTVLDPFAGSGTTGLVADRLQRDAILIELSPEYAEMAERRIRGASSLLARVELCEGMAPA